MHQKLSTKRRFTSNISCSSLQVKIAGERVMTAIQYALVSCLLLIVFPFSLNQMRVALDREDIESFSLWVFIASIIAGLPLMIMTIATVT